MNFVRTKESQLTQRGVHSNIEPFEHLCNGTRLNSETGLVERNADVTKEQERAVSSMKGPESNEEELQIHVNVLQPKENVKHDTDDEILHRQLEQLWKTDFGDSAVGIDTLPEWVTTFKLLCHGRKNYLISPTINQWQNKGYNF